MARRARLGDIRRRAPTSRTARGSRLPRGRLLSCHVDDCSARLDELQRTYNSTPIYSRALYTWTEWLARTVHVDNRALGDRALRTRNVLIRLEHLRVRPSARTPLPPPRPRRHVAAAEVRVPRPTALHEPPRDLRPRYAPRCASRFRRHRRRRRPLLGARPGARHIIAEPRAESACARVGIHVCRCTVAPLKVTAVEMAARCAA